MPAYEFNCAACGTFTVRRSVAEAGERAACPLCGHDASRVFSVGFSRGRPRAVRDAISRADATAAAPGIVTRAENGVRQERHGSVSRGSRPWQIEH